MSKLSVQLEYDRKIKELHSLVEQEAKKLQNEIDKRNETLFEIKRLSDKKIVIVNVLSDLEGKVVEKEKHLNRLIDMEQEFLSSIKKEQNREKEKYLVIKRDLGGLDKRVEETRGVVEEINSFLKKNKNARSDFIKESAKLDIVKGVSRKMIDRVVQELEKIDKRNDDLDRYKRYILDIYGKMASYVKVMNETVEYVNMSLKNNEIPIRFGALKDKIFEIDINNFQEQL